MKLDYGTITSPFPIPFTIGTIRKPTLGEIADPRVIGFQKFGLYESLLVLTPQEYYKYTGENADYYSALSEEEKKDLTMFCAIEHDKNLQEMYVSLFRLFFIEPVTYMEKVFLILEDQDQKESVKGVITEELFPDVLNIIKQICGMSADEDALLKDASRMKFKNKKARKLYEKIMKSEEKEKKNKKPNSNYSIPNIISAVCSCHPSINYTNVYQLTVYQLLDTFERLKIDSAFHIYRTSVAVWGNEKNWFDPELWYKNEYDKKNESA